MTRQRPRHAGRYAHSVHRILDRLRMRQYDCSQLGIAMNQHDFVSEDVRGFIEHDIFLRLACFFCGQLGFQTALVGLQTVVLMRGSSRCCWCCSRRFRRIFGLVDGNDRCRVINGSAFDFVAARRLTSGEAADCSSVFVGEFTLTSANLGWRSWRLPFPVRRARRGAPFH